MANNLFSHMLEDGTVNYYYSVMLIIETYEQLMLKFDINFSVHGK